MAWHKGPMAGYDTETTGVDVEQDRIVTATVALIRPGEPTDVRSHLVKVDVDIPAEATAIHGITTEHAQANGRPAVDVLDVVAADLAFALLAKVPVVGMNIAFDLTILDRELRRNGLPTLKAVDPYRRGKRRLPDLCATYGVRIDGAHDSAHDALAAARVAWRQAERHHHIRSADLFDLHEAQAQWRADQTASFRRYLMRELEQKSYDAEQFDEGSEGRCVLEQEADELMGRIADLDDAWPYRPYEARRVGAEVAP